MAGAGWKVFSAGAVLTAAEVNTYLMDQSVQVYAGTAARGSALGTAVAEGMTTYRTDANVVEVYDGSNWVDANALSSTQTSGRNRIINGGFDVNQRAFTSTTTTQTYGFDRWKMWASGGTVTYSAQTFTAGNAIAGYEPTNFARLVTASQSAAGDYGILIQAIEDVRTFAGQTVTISFWAKAASGTPGVGVELNQDFGSGGSPSATVNTAVGKVTLSTSWARYSVSVAVPSISGKTIGTTANTSSLQLYLWVSAGTTFASRASSIGAQNNTFDFWGVQVEKGSTATPFEVEEPGMILRKCQRFFYQHVIGSGIAFANAAQYSATEVDATVQFPVTMRSAPTLTSASGTNFYIFLRNGSNDAFNSFTITRAGVNAASIFNASEMSGTAGHAGWFETQNASCSVAFNSEL